MQESKGTITGISDRIDRDPAAVVHGHPDQLSEPDLPAPVAGAGLLEGLLRGARAGSRHSCCSAAGASGCNNSLWGFFILYGLSLSLFNSMWTFSVQFNGAAIATVLAFCSPAMTAVLAHYILKEQINRIKLLSILLSLPGIALVSGAVDPAAWKVNAAGIAFGLLTGFHLCVLQHAGQDVFQ